MAEHARKIGILGGTFDPVHTGHLLIARHARDALGLGKVIFIPAGRPWLKADRRIADARHRLAMVRLAIEGCPRFEASSMEIDRPGPTYTVDTLAELRRRLGNGAHLWLILGMDSAREMGRWREPERIFDMCEVFAMSRPETEDVSTDEIAMSFPAARRGIRVERGPMISISSSDIRARLAARLPIEDCVPKSVEGYIRARGLYL